MGKPFSLMVQRCLFWCKEKYTGIIGAVTVFNVILSSIQFMEIPGWLIAVSSFVFIAILFFGLIHRGKDSIKTVFFKCLIKGNVVSVTIFWGIIFSGILSNCISNHIEKKQESIDKEEFELAIKQFQKVTVYNQAFIPKDLRDFASGWQYLNQQQYSKAAAYLKKASSECAYAAYLYGMSLYSGLGVQPDKYQAIKYLDMAADKEVFDAKYLLMTHYFRMNDYATAERYALDIIRKAHFFIPLPVITPNQKIADEVLLPTFDSITRAYNILLDYYWRTERYKDAAKISHIMSEQFDSRMYQFSINEALSKLLDGDKYGAKKCFKQMLRKDGAGKGMREMAINYYVEHLLMPDENASLNIFSTHKIKEAEKLLIENIRTGNRRSVNLLERLYKNIGFEQKAAEISHLGSYYIIQQNYE